MIQNMMNPSPFLSIFCSLFHLFFLLHLSFSTDTLAPNQSLSDGQTLISRGHIFELGFFSPGRSKNRYLGIWYKTTPYVVVWVANRDNPLVDSLGVLTFNSTGTVVLANSTPSVIWSSSSGKSPAAASPRLWLLDTGNLLVQYGSSSDPSDYVWQSFDYPSDTRLPGMLMGQNLISGKEINITSWRSADEPSPGDFVYKIEQVGLSQLQISNGTRKRYRSGPWNGIWFNGLIMVGNQTFRGITDSSDIVKVFYIIDPYNASSINRLILTQLGSIERYVLDQRENVWQHSLTIPDNPCDIYGQCGPNGICNLDKSPICRCLQGTTPKSQQEWEKLEWSSGCDRNVTSDCQRGNTFTEMSGAKMPDLLKFQLKRNMNLSECHAECLKNCSCTAYANPYSTSRDTGCLMWYGDLMDMREFPEENNEQSFYVRVPMSEQGSISSSDKRNKGSATIIIWTSTVLGILTLVLICGCIAMKLRMKRRGLMRKTEELELPLFEFSIIAVATKNFSLENMIGEGGFGPVYKGKLSTGEEVAVKRLSKSSGQGIEQFRNEVTLIAKLQHRNLVRLLGCCIQGEERMLIYEYMQNNSLDQFIFDPIRKTLLPWPKRFGIIMGIARGILYLHQDSRLKIIHRDLKTSNILLDTNLFPKISDFGLAKLFESDQSFAKTKRVIGTYGYMAPEYAVDGKFSVKSDVFSMGVLILEICAGKKNRSFSHPDHHHNLLGHVWLLWNENRVTDMMDEFLEESFVEYQVKRCIQVGLLCVQALVEDRPEMSSVLFMLSNEEAKLPQPKEPGFFIERSSFHEETHSFGRERCNTDDMITMTDLEAR